jgi:hypothetical protein
LANSLGYGSAHVIANIKRQTGNGGGKADQQRAEYRQFGEKHNKRAEAIAAAVDAADDDIGKDCTLRAFCECAQKPGAWSNQTCAEASWYRFFEYLYPPDMLCFRTKITEALMGKKLFCSGSLGKTARKTRVVFKRILHVQPPGARQ